MEVKQVQIVQAHHAERLMRLERRQTEDAAIKSVWNPSPFPSVLGGTPQHGELIDFHYNPPLQDTDSICRASATA